VNKEEVKVLKGSDRLRVEIGQGRHGDRKGVPQGQGSGAAFHNCRKKYAGLMPSQMKRPQLPEAANGRLQKLGADLSFDEAIWQSLIRHRVLPRGLKLRDFA
jgi:hypothetical protein